MPYGLSENTINKLKQIFQKYEAIKGAILYGSRAMGNYTEGSDIDITLLGDHLDFKHIQKISTEIDNLMLPWIVDISIKDDIKNVDLIKHIKEVGIYIYEKDFRC